MPPCSASATIRRGERQDPPAPAYLTVYDDDAVVAIVTAERDGWLLLTDTFSTRWEATVDGEPAPFIALDLLWWGVPVPAGEHRVEVRFRRTPSTCAAGWESRDSVA